MTQPSTDAAAAWAAFRRAREDELAQPHGWLCLEGFHWLPDTPQELPGLPGRWWALDGEGHVEAAAADGLTVNGLPLHGASIQTVAELGRVPWVALGETDIELLNRDGRLAIRLRGATSPQREAFAGVPTYDYDPAWVVEGTFHPYPEPRRIEVATFRPELTQRIPAIGEVEFTLDGQPQRLVVTSIKSGLSVEFHDPTNGDETPAWRQLKFDAPDATGRVVLDFNRAINMWFAFTPHATCPAPTAGNTLTVPVRAGERS